MYMILGKAIVDVDSALFEKIGCVDFGVLAVPSVDQMLAIKGSASCPSDDETECQNTLYLTYEAGASEVSGYDVDFENAMEPGMLYRYRGHLQARQGANFVELKSEQRLGSLKLTAYFLVPVVDCEFAVSTDCGVEPYTLEELWQDGFIRRINNG